MKIIRMAAVLISFFSLAAGASAQAPTGNECQSSDVTGATYSSFTCTMTGATSSGNSIVVGVTYGNVNPSIAATDSAGDNFVLIGAQFDASHNQGLAILVASNIAASAQPTVTVNFGAPVGYLAIGAHELAGAWNLDTWSASLGSGAGPKTSLTPAAGDYVYSAVAEDSAGSGDTFTPGAGLTMLVNLGSAAAYADEGGSITLPGPESVGWALVPSGRSWITMAVGLKPGANSSSTGATPSISSLSPTSAAAGSAGLTLTVNGANFVSGDTVSFGGSTLATTYVSASQLTANVPASLISSAQTDSVYVDTASGANSNVVSFTVNPGGGNVVGTITFGTTSSSNISLTVPSNASVSLTATVTGSGFTTSTVIEWCESSPTQCSTPANLATTYVSATQVTIVIPASLLSPGTFTLTASTGTVSSLKITTPISLPAAVIGQAYSENLVALAGISGGVPPYHFALAGGTLPEGLSLSSSGILSGTPSASGSFSFSYTVEDSSAIASNRTEAAGKSL